MPNFSASACLCQISMTLVICRSLQARLKMSFSGEACVAYVVVLIGFCVEAIRSEESDIVPTFIGSDVIYFKTA